MKAKIASYAILVLFIAILQTTLFDYIKIFNVKPNILLVFTVSFAIMNGNVNGAVAGFFSGMVFDLMTGSILGLNTLLSMYTGLVCGNVNKRFYRDNIVVVMIMTFISTFLYSTIFYILTRSAGPVKINILHAIRHVVIPESIYNSFMSIFMYIIVIKLNHALNTVE